MQMSRARRSRSSRWCTGSAKPRTRSRDERSRRAPVRRRHAAATARSHCRSSPASRRAGAPRGPRTRYSTTPIIAIVNERCEHQRGVEQAPAGQVDQDAETTVARPPTRRRSRRRRRASRRRARRRGSAARRPALRCRVSSCHRGGPEAAAEFQQPRGRPSGSPTIVATAIGKKTIRAQMRTLLPRPLPNQSAISGASARIGVACAATMYGESSRSAMCERASTIPISQSAAARPPAARAPPRVSVVDAWGWMIPFCHARGEPCRARSAGRGRMYEGTARQRTTASRLRGR